MNLVGIDNFLYFDVMFHLSSIIALECFNLALTKFFSVRVFSVVRFPLFFFCMGII